MLHKMLICRFRGSLPTAHNIAPGSATSAPPPAHNLTPWHTEPVAHEGIVPPKRRGKENRAEEKEKKKKPRRSPRLQENSSKADMTAATALAEEEGKKEQKRGKRKTHAQFPFDFTREVLETRLRLENYHQRKSTPREPEKGSIAQTPCPKKAARRLLLIFWKAAIEEKIRYASGIMKHAQSTEHPVQGISLPNAPSVQLRMCRDGSRTESRRRRTILDDSRELGLRVREVLGIIFAAA
ncbi:hypothetical protein C8R44DRAFT_851632 [Mycena epipterygia]|nr:hypothetical protein C8R44DRAFT_851632 [Mycena epipterygia]